MTTVFIPAQLRDLTGGVEQIAISIPPGETRTVREILDELERLHPGLEERLLVEGDLTPYLAVFIDGEPAGLGLQARVKQEHQVYFLAPVVGGD